MGSEQQSPKQSSNGNGNSNSNNNNNSSNAGLTNSSCVLYLGAIPYNWDVEVIKSVVCGSGPVVDVRCMMDNASKNKGFCFVEYSTPEAASRALSVLSKVKIEGRKKLRIELSKEGLRNPVPSGSKPELQLNRALLPSNVILPSEMTGNSRQSHQNNRHSRSLSNSNSTEAIMAAIAANPHLQKSVSQMIASGMDVNQIAQVIQQFPNNGGANGNRQQQTPTPPPVVPAPMQQHQNSLLPINLTMASSYLPPNPPRSIYAKDKVSEILSSIPPGILIESLSRLKLILAQPQPNYHEATMILNENPKLAIAAAQSLLLMGIIDLDVISSATASAATILILIILILLL
ncbi:unnamed protein product [Ambrosiozyma monospora]|uniref:Unnamed protein product n=1 Tax=Ambrosiozyma monospora TaxID=43982 RepID=A0ACB5TCG5_AMBMO|nr:unnamed protein product [Ambrosiozyma monospora]